MHGIIFPFTFLSQDTIFSYNVARGKSWHLFWNVQNNEITSVLYIGITRPGV